MSVQRIPVMRFALALMLQGLLLAGCATTPVKVATPPAPRPLVVPVTMAPIPNPPTHEVTRPRAAPADASAHRSPGKPPPAPAPAPANPFRAAGLRAAGLEELERGEFAKAVALLQRASQLEPDNALIKHDLERAIRLAQPLATKP